MRNKKICIICGRSFDCPPSDKTVTCSPECRRKHAKNRLTGRVLSKESKRKISEKAKGRDMRELQIKGTEAAMKSPKSGRFITNVNAKDWHLISPEGQHYKFHSLNFWAREHCELFGFEKSEQSAMKIRRGIANAKRATLGKVPEEKHPCATYKGWQVVVDNEEKQESPRS